MSRSVPQTAVALEDKRLDRRDREFGDTVKELDSLPFRMAKAAIGAAVKHAIGDAPMKQYGDEGQMSKVISGERVPDYLARIYEDRAARTRYALSLLRGDPRVKVRTVVEFDDEEIA
jgi:hypothetical protein